MALRNVLLDILNTTILLIFITYPYGISRLDYEFLTGKFKNVSNNKHFLFELPFDPLQ